MCYICQECVDDVGLRAYVQSQGQMQFCSFCENPEAAVLCADIDETIQYTIEKIFRHYEDPANSVGYESAEGGYQLPTMNSWELLEEVGLTGANEAFLKLLENRLDADAGIWVRKDPYASAYHEQLTYDWRDFGEEVKHRCRFTFFRSSEKHIKDGDTAVEHTHEILNHIGSIVEIAQTFIELNPGDSIYRGRVHLLTVTYSSSKELGSPPPEHAKQSRMSPAGISMFYGSRDVQTALAELQPKPGEIATVGIFTPVRKLLLVDFSRLSWESSIFAYESETEPEAAVFLNNFAMEISKPVARDDRVHVEYVPTQVVTEYFRFLFPKDHSAVDGIAFRSSLRRGGVNIVLFADQDHCSELLTFKSCDRITKPPIQRDLPEDLFE